MSEQIYDNARVQLSGKMEKHERKFNEDFREILFLLD